MKVLYKGFLFLLFLFLCGGLSSFAFKPDSLSNLIEETEDDSVKVALLIKYGDELMGYRLFQAEEQYQRAYDIAESKSNTNGLRRTLIKLGEVRLKKGNLQEAGEFFKKAISKVKEQLQKKAKHKELGKAYYEISAIWFNSGHTDSAYKYIEKSLLASKKAGNINMYPRSFSLQGLVYHQKGELNKAIESQLKSLRYSAETNDTVYYIHATRNLGNNYQKKGDFEKAVEYQLKAMNMAEKSGNTTAYVYANISLGNIYIKRQNPSKAETYFLSALAYVKNNNDHYLLSVINNNLGNVLFQQEKYEEAKAYYTQSLKAKRKLGDYSSIASILSNLGNIALLQDNKSSALTYYKRAISIFDSLGNVYGKAATHNNLAKVYLDMGQYEKALKHANSGLQLSRRTGSKQWARNSCKILSDTYYELGNHKEAFYYLNDYRLLKDSIRNIQTDQKIAEMEARYKNEKKEKELSILEAEEDIQKQQLKKNKIMFYGVSFGSGLVLVTALILLYGFIKRRKANRLLSRKNKEIRRKSLIISQKNKEITDSIRYASNILKAILPSGSRMKHHLGEHFVIFRAKNLVSGDFYWTEEQDKNVVFFAVCDSSERDVTGAFSNLMAYNALHKALNIDHRESPKMILESINASLFRALNSNENEEKKGIGISLCKWDKKTNTLYYCGAGVPAWVKVSKEPDDLEPAGKAKNGKCIYEFPFSKNEAGKNKNTAFHEHKLTVRPGDRITLFSRGIMKLFGNMDAGMEELQSTLLTDAPADAQKQKIEQLIKAHAEEKVPDDLCILSVKVT